MGISLSLLLSAWNEIIGSNFFSDVGSAIVGSIGFEREDEVIILRTSDLTEEKSEIMSQPTHISKASTAHKSRLRTSFPLNDLILDKALMNPVSPRASTVEKVLKAPEQFLYSSPIQELDAAATKLQKVYKSYRTRRNLADCAVLVEELWWKALDFAALKRSSVSFFDIKRQETAASKWARAKTRVAKVGKGLSKDENAQKLALQHWLEAIDPRHRYGHNLHLYYDVWFESRSAQPFFYWLDVGDGKEVNLESCPRTVLQRQCIKYLGPKERDTYEVIVEDGKLVYKQSGILLDTLEGYKWIFVLSTARKLYVGQKKKGCFQHSSFLSGGATTAAGRLVAHDGLLEAIWPYSGHYLPTEDNFKEFITFLEENSVDLTDVKRCATDDDRTSFKIQDEESKTETVEDPSTTGLSVHNDVANDVPNTAVNEGHINASKAGDAEVPVFDLARRLSCKWTSGVGPRIGCVRDYPSGLQLQALEQVNLSPRVTPGQPRWRLPIPSPRPGPSILVSPRLSLLGQPSPRVHIASIN